MKLTTIILLILLYQVFKLNFNKNGVKEKISSKGSNIFTTPSNLSSDRGSKIKERKNKIKDKKVHETVNEDELVKDTIHKITEERLQDIDKQEEEKLIMSEKINFKRLLDDNDIEEDINLAEVNYDDILNTQFKVDLANTIVENEEHLWFGDPKLSNSKVDIPQKKFKVIEYSF